MVNIRRVKLGDENSLAYIQTESWKEAFGDIVPADLLSKCTELGHVTAMYRIKFYEKYGFVASGKKQHALGAVEEMYVCSL